MSDKRNRDLDNAICERVHAGIKERLGSSVLMQAAQSRALQSVTQGPTKKRCAEILHMNNPFEVERWSEIHNTPERYAVIGENQRVDPNFGPYYWTEFFDLAPEDDESV